MERNSRSASRGSHIHAPTYLGFLVAGPTHGLACLLSHEIGRLEKVFDRGSLEVVMRKCGVEVLDTGEVLSLFRTEWERCHMERCHMGTASS